jgi:NAD(P)-dependent dehydrogenase (short-subunit alcohol dehydrogenase family)
MASNVGPEYVASGQLVTHRVDVSDSAAMQALADHLAATDPIDTLVCAAGTNITGRRLHQVSFEDFDKLVATNLSGTFYALRATLDQLRERQGDVVLISSVAGAWPDHSGPAYQATKAGLLGLARGAGWDEHGSGIRVCTILPGIVNTPILDLRPVPPSDEVKAACVQPEDVAEAALCALTLAHRTTLAEMTLVSTLLQSLGNTQAANPALPNDR